MCPSSVLVFLSCASFVFLLLPLFLCVSVCVYRVSVPFFSCMCPPVSVIAFVPCCACVLCASASLCFWCPCVCACLLCVGVCLLFVPYLYLLCVRVPWCSFIVPPLVFGLLVFRFVSFWCACFCCLFLVLPKFFVWFWVCGALFFGVCFGWWGWFFCCGGVFVGFLFVGWVLGGLFFGGCLGGVVLGAMFVVYYFFVFSVLECGCCGCWAWCFGVWCWCWWVGVWVVVWWVVGFCVFGVCSGWGWC